MWVEQARAGDPDAFEAIFRLYYERLCAFAEGYCGSADAAEDLVEDVFMRLWEQRERCVGCSPLKAYLYAAVRNRGLRLIRHLRVVRRSAELFGDDDQPPGMGTSGAAPDEGAYCDALAEAARYAVERLPERSRQAYVLHREHGMSYAEIAAIMGVSVKTVENHLARAVRSLREALSGWLV